MSCWYMWVVTSPRLDDKCVWVYMYKYIYIYIAYMYLATHDVLIFDLAHSYVTWCIHMRHDSCLCDADTATAAVFANLDFTSGRWQICVCIYIYIYIACIYIAYMYLATHDVLIIDMTHPYVTRCIHMWRDSCICDAATGTAEILAVAPADRDVASGRWHIYIFIYMHIYIWWHMTCWHVTWRCVCYRTHLFAAWHIHTWRD